MNTDSKECKLGGSCLSLSSTAARIHPINVRNELFKKYIHDIRNLKTLDKEMKLNIREMSCENKMEIISVLNDIVESLKFVLEK